MLTRLNAIAGVASSSALLANDGNRMIQIRIRPGANATKAIEEVQRALRAEVQNETPMQREDKSADTFGSKQDWLTVGQLNALAAQEKSSSSWFDGGFWLLVLAALIALCALLFWLLRRRRNARQTSEVRLD